MFAVFQNFAAACDLPTRVYGIPTWYKYFKGDDTTGRCSPAFNLQADLTGSLTALLLGVFDILLFVAGLVAIGFIIFGAFQYMLSQGNPEGSKNGRTTIINALIGLVIVLMSTTLVSFIAGNI